MFFTPFYFSETHFTPPLPIKVLAVLDRTRKVDFFSPPIVPQHIFVPLLRRTKPTCWCRAELFVLLCFSSAPWLLQCTSSIVDLNFAEFFPSPPVTNFILFCATFLLSYLLLTTLPSTRIFLFLYSGGERSRLVNTSFSSAALFRSQTSYHRHAEITRGEEILA